MTTRDAAPIGAPCWIELSTSDPGRSGEFYAELFGWTAEEPNEQFGGYFNFRRNDIRVAGAMASEPGGPANLWSVYLASDDAQKTVDAATAQGGQIVVPPMPVGDLGTMAVVTDAGGAGIGVWQPGAHQGFGVHTEPGTPSWFELHTRAYDASVAFYRDVFRWDTHATGDIPEFRYTVQQHGEEWLAGIMDAASFLPEGAPAQWYVYFGSANVDADLARTVQLGGSIEAPGEDTPYGRLATALDPTGARFKLIEDNR
jgi:hypothetical protein